MAPGNVEFQPLSTTREQRGRALAQRGGIRTLGGRFLVPSATSGADAPTYVVDLVEPSCTCQDHATRRLACKHIEAALFWVAWEGVVSGEPAKPVKRKNYPRNWAAYNEAQVTEKSRVELLLKSLCSGIEAPPRKPGSGRPPVALRDVVFCCVMKIYTTVSGRRASSDLAACEERGHITKAMHFNVLFNAMADERTTEILMQLIEQAAAPLAVIENRAGQFAQDSTGFSTATYDRWFEQKHGKLRAKHEWVKLHLMCGTATHVISGVRVSSEADSPVMPALIAQTAKTFEVKEVSGDKAYLSKKNLAAIDQVGAVAFIPFKSNSLGMSSQSPQWQEMWARFTLRGDEFMRHYHRRSNAETVMWMLKSKFGGYVRSKTPRAQVNELLAKVLLHNLCCVIGAITEFGIDVGFDKTAESERTTTSVPTLTLVRP